jgi:heme A synthase
MLHYFLSYTLFTAMKRKQIRKYKQVKRRRERWVLMLWTIMFLLMVLGIAGVAYQRG